MLIQDFCRIASLFFLVVAIVSGVFAVINTIVFYNTHTDIFEWFSSKK